MLAIRPEFALLLVMVWVLAACGPRPSSDAPEESPNAPSDNRGALREAPQGDGVVPVGDGAIHLEVLLDGNDGAIRLFLWDREKESLVRVQAEAIELRVSLPGEGPSTLILTAVANSRRGATTGDASEFVGQASWLVGASSFVASIPRLSAQGMVYKDIAFRYPAIPERQMN